MAATSSAIADLKSQWPNLRDLDRAKEVRALKLSGASIRGLASQLQVGESGLRRLLKALEAPAEDRLLAHDGKITTNELIRRATAAKHRDKVKQGEALNLKRTEASIKAAKTICNWLRSEGVTSFFGQQVVGEARKLLIKADQSKKFPLGAVPPRMPLAEIILRSRPDRPNPTPENETPWRAFWLAIWVYRAWPDTWVRQKAIELALEEQLGRAGTRRR